MLELSSMYVVMIFAPESMIILEERYRYYVSHFLKDYFDFFLFLSSMKRKRTMVARRLTSGSHTYIRKPSSLGNFLYGCLHIPGVHVSLEIKLGNRVVSEDSEQEIKISWKVITL